MSKKDLDIICYNIIIIISYSIIEMAAQYPSNIEKSIQSWVEVDNELKKINDKVKDLRTRKNDLEDKIMDYVQENEMNNNFINISDGKLKFCETKQTSPITLGFLEKCLGEIIANQQQVKQIMEYIKNKREQKVVPEIKRYYN
jgi:septal ring factor EnvC (AmiA/AmiB activator)